MKTALAVLASTSMLLLASTAASAQLAHKPALTLEAARVIMSAAEEVARDSSWNVVIAVVDDGGHAILLQRMDGAQIGSVEVALRKAETSVFFRRPSGAFADLVAGGAHAVLVLPGALPLAGGVPVVVDGTVIGAVGVSGVTSRQDEVIARAGADALTRQLSN